MNSGIPYFVAHLKKHPLLIPNRYHVVITGPLGVFPDSISINCINAMIPARSMATVERFVAGPMTKVPYVELFDDMSLTFRASADLYERALIDQWMNKIGGVKYGCAYFNDIKGQINIDVYNQDNTKMKSYKFIDAVPISLSETSLADNAEELSTFTVQFAYHHYEWE